MNQHLSTGFSESLIRQIFTGIVGAVGLMHENGYSHRDLKVLILFYVCYDLCVMCVICYVYVASSLIQYLFIYLSFKHF